MRKFYLHYDSFVRSGQELISGNEDVIDRSVFHGIKMMNISAGKLMQNYQFSQVIMRVISHTTPRRFSRIFPIAKVYDGFRYDMKDYFSTVEMIEENGWDEPIKDPFEFLWDYDNAQTRRFLVNHMSLVDEKRRVQGKRGMAEEWIEKNGLNTYRLQRNNRQQYLIDQNGRTKSVSTRKSNHLKVVR